MTLTEIKDIITSDIQWINTANAGGVSERQTAIMNVGLALDQVKAALHEMGADTSSDPELMNLAWEVAEIEKALTAFRGGTNYPTFMVKPVVHLSVPMTNLQPIVAHHEPWSTLVASHPYVAPKQYQIKGGGQ